MLCSSMSVPFTDLWALGVMAFQLLCGDYPFKGNTRDQIFEKIKKRDF